VEQKKEHEMAITTGEILHDAVEELPLHVIPYVSSACMTKTRRHIDRCANYSRGVDK